MKKIFTFIFLLSAVLCKAQGPKFKAFLKVFLENYCTCLQSNPALSATTILYSKTDTCVAKIIAENNDAIFNLLDEFTFNEALSEYERGVYIGKLLVFEGIDELVPQCPFYVSTLKRYFEEVSTEKGLTPEKIDKAIDTFKEVDANLKEESNRHTLVQVLGVLYYAKADYQNALTCFERANVIKPSTISKSFIAMIKQYDLRKK